MTWKQGNTYWLQVTVLWTCKLSLSNEWLKRVSQFNICTKAACVPNEVWFRHQYESWWMPIQPLSQFLSLIAWGSVHCRPACQLPLDPLQNLLEKEQSFNTLDKYDSCFNFECEHNLCPFNPLRASEPIFWKINWHAQKAIPSSGHTKALLLLQTCHSLILRGDSYTATSLVWGQFQIKELRQQLTEVIMHLKENDTHTKQAFEIILWCSFLRWLSTKLEICITTVKLSLPYKWILKTDTHWRRSQCLCPWTRKQNKTSSTTIRKLFQRNTNGNLKVPTKL